MASEIKIGLSYEANSWGFYTSGPQGIAVGTAC